MDRTKFSIVTWIMFLLLNTAAKATDEYRVLWVVDNSPSYPKMIALLKSSFSKFLKPLTKKSIRYEMSVVTTDAFTFQGEMVKSAKGFDTVADKSKDPVQDFSDILDGVTGPVTAFWEQGLESSYLALKKHGGHLVKTNIPLVVIYISDENDYSCASDCFGVQPENNPDWKAHPTKRYIDFFKNLESKNVPVKVFPLVGLPNSTCSLGSVGTRYLEVMKGIGSSPAGSICDKDFGRSLARLGKQLANGK